MPSGILYKWEVRNIAHCLASIQFYTTLIVQQDQNGGLGTKYDAHKIVHNSFTDTDRTQMWNMQDSTFKPKGKEDLPWES